MEDVARSQRIFLAACSGVEPTSIAHLIEAVGSVGDLWCTDIKDWQSVSRLKPSTLHRLAYWIRSTSLDALFTMLDAAGIQTFVKGDDLYPTRLLDLEDPPDVLFMKGNKNRLRHLDSLHIASVVGTRRATGYALEVAKWLSETLVRHDIAVVSGMAEGIDAAAHEGALSGGGDTLAVLGCGVNICYPKHAQTLYKRILEQGVVLSEYAPNEPVARYRFPQRNRIIASLSPVVVIVQAGDKSGAMHTVDHALRIGRDVFAVPGPITSKLYAGSNRLLQQGAAALVHPLDIVHYFDIPAEKAESRPRVPERWAWLYEVLYTPKTPSSLAIEASRPISHVHAGLLELEASGVIIRGPGGVWRRKEGL